MKKCKMCKEIKSLVDFYRCANNKDGTTHLCKECTKLEKKRVKLEKQLGTFVSRIRKPRLTEQDKLDRSQEQVEYHKKYRIEKAEQISKSKKVYINKVKLEGLSHYGNACSCCGEDIKEFLTIEHLEGRDKSEKRYTGKKMWARAKSEGYPNKYTILCFNCNLAKGAYGICPHELLKENKCEI